MSPHPPAPTQTPPEMPMDMHGVAAADWGMESKAGGQGGKRAAYLKAKNPVLFVSSGPPGNCKI